MKTENTAVQLVAALLMLGLLGLTTRAQAEDIQTYDVDCATLQGLHDATGELWFANQKDLDGLQGKVDEAIAKTAEGKTCDATQKLRDYKSKLTNLMSATKPKVSEVHPDTLACIDTALGIHIDESCDTADKPPRGKGPKK